MNDPIQRILIFISWHAEDGITAERYKSHAHQHQEVTVRQLDTFFVSWNGKHLEVTDMRGEVRLEDYDAVHFAGWQLQSDMAYAIATILKQRGIPFMGRTILDLYPGSKVGEMTRLTTQAVPYPKSFYTCNNDRIVALWDWAHQKHRLEFPVIVKASTASKGDDNFLVHSRDELAALDLQPAYQYLMQECIPNDRDYRALVMNGEVKVIIERTRQDTNSHLNNTSQGATARLVELQELPAHFATVALSAAKALAREDIAGVDVLVAQDTDDLYVLEVNKTPHMAIGATNVIDQKLDALFDQLEVLAGSSTQKEAE